MGQRGQPDRTRWKRGTLVFTVLAASSASLLLHGCGGPKAQPPSEAAHASEDLIKLKTEVQLLRKSVQHLSKEHRDKAPAHKEEQQKAWFWKSDKKDHKSKDGAKTQENTTTPDPPTPAPTPAPPAYCSDVETDCRATKCCSDPNMRCYSKNQWWAECLNKSSCVPGIHKEDPLKYRSNWSCMEISGPTPPPFHGWNYGTWTTGYWDCCKPSCAWPRKGNQTKPVRACHSRTGDWLDNASEVSVCDGGAAASCTSHHPFVVNDGLSMGFAAAAVRGGEHHLTGDSNCGQCYELVFTDAQHKVLEGNWGGASQGLVDRRMIVQVTNIGEDVEGNHSFDLQIPGAGLGSRTNGCTAQFPGTEKDDFDCGLRFGGCESAKGCDKLPKDLQSGCRWRYNWLEWLKKGGRTNNPFVRFRRVKCPLQLTDISGSVPHDDEDGWLIVM